MKNTKADPYLPKGDFNHLCKLIEKEGLTFEKFIKLFPEDKESQKTLINYIHSYDSGWTANPTILEFLISNCHVSTLPEDLDKITRFLLESGSPITTLLLENKPKNKLCREWVLTHQVSNWSCTGTNKESFRLLSDLIGMKFPVDTLEKIVELESKSKPTACVYLTNQAFEYLKKDEKYATGLINFLIKHQLFALSAEAFQQDSVMGRKLIKELGSRCLDKYNFFRKDNIKLLNYILKMSEEPFDLIKALLNEEPEDLGLKIFQNLHLHMKKSYFDLDILNPLETVISRYVDQSLSLPKTEEIIIFLLKKGAFPSSHVLLTLKKIKNSEIQNALLSSIMLNHVPKYIETGVLRFDKPYYPGYICELLGTLLQFKPPILWISQITDFVDTCYWGKSFYEWSDNNLLEIALKVNQDKTYTLQLIEFLLKKNIPINLIKLNESFDKIEDKEFCGQLLELLLPKLIQLFNLDSSKDKMICKLLCHNLDKAVDFIDVLKKTNLDYRSTIDRLIDSLQLAYTDTENSLLRNNLSELMGIMPQPFQQENPLSLEGININPGLSWLDQSSYYFTEVKSHLREQLNYVMPQALLSIICDYAKSLNLTETIIKNHESKSIRKLIVQTQDIGTSDCGAYAFTYGLLLLSFLNKNLKLAISILKNTPYQSEEKQPARRVFEMALHAATTIASEKKQGDNDVSPITMRRMVHNPEFKKFFHEIHAIHKLYPAIVPVIKNETYQITPDFDIREQLNMLYKFVELSNLYHCGKSIYFPFYIFTENHWITLLMIRPEVSDKAQRKQDIFLVCDSLRNNSIEFLTPVTLPVQKAVTDKENLRDLCKKLLASSYQEIELFIKSGAWMTDFPLRHIKLQLRVWLALMKHDDLKNILGDTDAIKFEIMVRLIAECEKLTQKFTVKKHKRLISELRKLDLFSGNENKALIAELKEPNDDNSDLVTLIKIANILKIDEFKADKGKIDKIYDRFIKNRFVYSGMMTQLVDKIKKAVDISDKSLMNIALELQLIRLEVTERPKEYEDKGLQEKLLFCVQSLSNRLESEFLIRNNYIRLIEVAKLFEISIPFDSIQFLEDKKNDINTHIDKHIADYITIKDQIIAKINRLVFKKYFGCDDFLFKVAVAFGILNQKLINILQTIPGASAPVPRLKEDLLRRLELFIPCEIRQILKLKKVIRLAFLSGVITREDTVAWIYSLDKDPVTAASCQSLLKEISDKISCKNKSFASYHGTTIASGASSSSTSSSSSSSCSSSSSTFVSETQPSVRREDSQTVTLLMQSLTEIFKSKKDQETTEESSSRMKMLPGFGFSTGS